MEPEIYIIKPHVGGDTWDGITLTITVNGIAPEYALESVKIQFRKAYSGSVVLELDSSKETIEIADASAWRIIVPAQIVTLPPNNYVYDIETVDSFGRKKTYIKGTWEILKDVTK